MTACEHRESPNPRTVGWCCKCGKKIPRHELRRDVTFEREMTRTRANGLKIDPEPLNIYAEARAGRGAVDYGTDFPGSSRCLFTEALQELADARNYIVWQLDVIRRSDDGHDDGQWRVEPLQRALASVALAFEDVRSCLISRE